MVASGVSVGQELGLVELVALRQTAVLPAIDEAPLFLVAILDGVALKAVGDHMDLAQRLV